MVLSRHSAPNPIQSIRFSQIKPHFHSISISIWISTPLKGSNTQPIFAPANHTYARAKNYGLELIGRPCGCHAGRLTYSVSKAALRRGVTAAGKSTSSEAILSSVEQNGTFMVFITGYKMTISAQIPTLKVGYFLSFQVA